MPTADPLADLRRRLRAAGLNSVVAPVATRVDVGLGSAADYCLLALVQIGPEEKERIAEVMGLATYTINASSFSDGYWSEAR